MYLTRMADSQLEAALRRAGAVVIEGPKACGKTATALQVAASTVSVDTDPNVEQLIGTLPAVLLDGPTPRLFDEWHLQPALWNLVRRRVDDVRRKGQFILTGSAAPSAELSRHSGAGRFARVRMHTMTLLETGHSSGAVRIADLVAGRDVEAGPAALGFAELITRLATGGWPGFLDSSTADALLGVQDYLHSLVEVDLRELGGSSHDPVRVHRLLRALARGVATEVNLTTLAADAELSRDAARAYVATLGRVFACEDQPAWSSHLRSRATLRQEPKRHLADPSLAVAALETGPDQLLRDLAYAGQLFESQAVHDLRVYSQRVVSHARDSAGVEVDAVVEQADGSLLLAEVKLGWQAAVVEQAVNSLSRFAAKVDRSRHPEIVQLVITGGGYAYRRPDGAYVVPLATLGP